MLLKNFSFLPTTPYNLPPELLFPSRIVWIPLFIVFNRLLDDLLMFFHAQRIAFGKNTVG